MKKKCIQDYLSMDKINDAILTKNFHQADDFICVCVCVCVCVRLIRKLQ